MNNSITENNRLFGDGLGSPITESDAVTLSIVRHPSYDSNVVSIVSSPLKEDSSSWMTMSDEDLLFLIIGSSEKIFELEMKIKRLIPVDFIASSLESSYCFQQASELSYFGEHSLLETELKSIIEVCNNEIANAGQPEINRIGVVI